MGNYSKAFGALVGGIVGSLVAFGIIPDGAVPVEAQAAIVTLASLVSTYIFPANKAS